MQIPELASTRIVHRHVCKVTCQSLNRSMNWFVELQLTMSNALKYNLNWISQKWKTHTHLSRSPVSINFWLIVALNCVSLLRLKPHKQASTSATTSQ